MNGDILRTLGAGTTQGSPSVGNRFIYKDEANGLPIDVLINGAARRMEVGDSMEVDLNARVRVKNPNAQAVSIRFFHGFDLYTSAKARGDVSVLNFAAGSVAGSGDVAIANGVTDVIAENPTRRELTIQADPNNAGMLRIRDRAGNPFAWLDAGGSITVPSSDEIQVHNGSGGAQTYAYSESLQ